MLIRCWKAVCPQSMTVPAAFLSNSDAPVREFTSPDSRPGTDEGLQNLVLPFQFFRALQKANVCLSEDGGQINRVEQLQDACSQ